MSENEKYLRVWNDKFNSEGLNLSIEKIVRLVREDKDGLVFLVRRYGHINVYFLGTVILDYDGKHFTFNSEYIKYLPAGTADLFPHKGRFLEFESWYNSLNDIKHAMHNRNKTSREKAAQQAIMQAVNANPDSMYYIMDVEYDYPSIQCGRFDMIAVSKIPVNGKHKVAIIELKCGTESFRGSPTAANEYGSGIVGHALNLSRFINGTRDEKGTDAVRKRLSDLATELASASNVCNRFALNPAPFLPALNKEDFDIDDIQTWLLCVGCKNPKTAEQGVLRYLGYPADGQKNNPNVKDNVTPDMKLHYKVTSANCLESLHDSDFTDARNG